MTQKTAIAELIEDWMRQMQNSQDKSRRETLLYFINDAKSKLPKERKDLIDAHKAGIENVPYFDSPQKDAEQYVHEKFGI